MKRARFGEFAGVCAACVAATVAATWPLTRFAASRVPIDTGDSLENVWIFSWIAHALVHSPIHIWAGNIFFPAHHTLAFAEAMLGTAVPAAPLYWLTGNGVLTVSIATIAIYAVGGVGTYLLLRDLFEDRGVALVGALAFTVTPYRVASIFHPHVIGIHFLPFILWALLRRKNPFVLALLVAWQVYASFTGAILLAIVVSSWAVWELLRRARGALPDIRRAAAGVGIGIVISVPVAIPYVLAHHEYPEYAHSPRDQLVYAATPGSYLSPEAVGRVAAAIESPLRDEFRNGEAPWEKTLFPGIWLSVFGVAGLVLVVRSARLRDRPAHLGFGALFALMGSAAFVLSLGPRLGLEPDGIVLPYAIIAHAIPGNLVRVAARIGQLVLFSLVGLAGVALVSMPPRWRRAVVVGSIAILALETVPASMPMVRVPPITEAHLAVAKTRGAVLMLPTGVPLDEPENMYLSTAHFHAITNGYASFVPIESRELVAAVKDLPSKEALAYLQTRGIATIVVRRREVAGTRWADAAYRLKRWPGVRLIAADAHTDVYDIATASSLVERR